jgi:hypothetical protein
VVAFLAIALAASTRASTETDQPIAEPSSVAAISLPATAPHLAPATKDQLKVPAPIAPAPTHVVTPPRASATEQRNSEKVSERRADRARISIPTVPSNVTSRVDSLVRAAGTPKGILTETVLVPGTLSTANLQRSGFDYLDPEKPQGSHVRLIGSLPQPRYTNPDVEGEVLVNFGVDAAGHPEMGSFSVVNSRNEFLTAAIRKVIEGLRFEPARTAAPESKPIGERVQIRFVFPRSTR